MPVATRRLRRRHLLTAAATASVGFVAFTGTADAQDAPAPLVIDIGPDAAPVLNPIGNLLDDLTTPLEPALGDPLGGIVDRTVGGLEASNPAIVVDTTGGKAGPTPGRAFLDGRSDPDEIITDEHAAGDGVIHPAGGHTDTAGGTNEISATATKPRNPANPGSASAGVPFTASTDTGSDSGDTIELATPASSNEPDTTKTVPAALVALAGALAAGAAAATWRYRSLLGN